jgi:hypothetical protein
MKEMKKNGNFRKCVSGRGLDEANETFVVQNLMIIFNRYL